VVVISLTTSSTIGSLIIGSSWISSTGSGDTTSLGLTSSFFSNDFNTLSMFCKSSFVGTNSVFTLSASCCPTFLLNS